MMETVKQSTCQPEAYGALGLVSGAWPGWCQVNSGDGKPLWLYGRLTFILSTHKPTGKGWPWSRITHQTLMSLVPFLMAHRFPLKNPLTASRGSPCRKFLSLTALKILSSSLILDSFICVLESIFLSQVERKSSLMSPSHSQYPRKVNLSLLTRSQTRWA